MRIKDVENRTGLSRKCIRFYEAKGLLNVKRSDNSYREYDEPVIARLQTIAVLRQAGVSISDIQLWQDQVISREEMLQKRISELKDHTELTAAQLRLCRGLLKAEDPAAFFSADGLIPEELPEQAAREQEVPPDAVLCLGLDIGTTTISAVVLNLSAGTAVSAYTIRNDADLPGDHPWEKCQDVRKIEARVEKLLQSLLGRYPGIRAMGLTGQMHGILYLNGQNTPCSPLYTWQDGRAGQGDPSTCRILNDLTGISIAPGYGLATHCHLLRTGKLPANAVRLCTVMDYLTWKLCGFSSFLMHSSNAASLGFFDQTANDFRRDALTVCGIQPSFLPEVTNRCCVVGKYRHIPVSVALGDNQASFFGTVRDPDAMILANFGTGSQISMLTDGSAVCAGDGEIESRPFLEDHCILSGSALCGGRAYALLEVFFRSFAGENGLRDGEQYEVLNRLALRGLERGNAPEIRTTFCGTRRDPTLRGEIRGIGEDNFTPEAFAAGILLGMARELHDMYRRMPCRTAATVVASGNAVRKNPALKLALEQVFGTAVWIPAHREEAAYGAAMFAALSAGLAEKSEILQNCIRYQP